MPSPTRQVSDMPDAAPPLGAVFDFQRAEAECPMATVAQGSLHTTDPRDSRPSSMQGRASFSPPPSLHHRLSEPPPPPPPPVVLGLAPQIHVVPDRQPYSFEVENRRGYRFEYHQKMMVIGILFLIYSMKILAVLTGVGAMAFGWWVLLAVALALALYVSYKYCTEMKESSLRTRIETLAYGVFCFIIPTPISIFFLATQTFNPYGACYHLPRYD